MQPVLLAHAFDVACCWQALFLDNSGCKVSWNHMLYDCILTSRCAGAGLTDMLPDDVPS